MRVISESRIWEAKEKWPRSATALDQWYRVIKHLLDHHDYEKDKWKEKIK